ncbi:MAG: hypothetical protein ABIP17_08405 [Ilumatobacteraceae bacterium]
MSEPEPIPTLPPSVGTPARSAGPPPPVPPIDPVEPPGPVRSTATRNVPKASATTNYGLPTKTDAEPTPFERPELPPTGPSVVALVVGRTLIIAAVLLVGVAAAKVGDGSLRRDAFWSVVAAAGVFVAVAVAGQVFWAATLADGARRLKVRGMSVRGQVIVWAIVAGWVVVACVGYLRIEVDGDLDPLPVVAIGGVIVAMAVAYQRLRAVFAGLSRTPPKIMLTVFPLDALVFGVGWWRLSDLSAERSEMQTTATMAYVGGLIAAVNALLFVWLSRRGEQALAERVRRLEMQHRQTVEGTAPGPDWLQRRHLPEAAVTPNV